MSIFTSSDVLKTTLRKLCIELIVRIFCVFFLQTLYNYAVLLYAIGVPLSPTAYMGVTVTEYALRTETNCYFQRAVSSAEMAIVFFSWL